LMFRARQGLVRHLGEQFALGFDSSNGVRGAGSRIGIPGLPLATEKGQA